MHPLKKILFERDQSRIKGVYSICSANELVLKAACLKAKETDTYVLIEATANQVNQYGGYTGMTPHIFVKYGCRIAEETGLGCERVIFGGDHLGPLVWKNEPEESAMLKAAELIRDYVEAGFTKIHIDTSMRLASDSKTERLSDLVIAKRAAMLAAVCKESKEQQELVYVIGSEVPVPGGVAQEEELSVTSASDFIGTLQCFEAAFRNIGLADDWSDVVGIVVQSGVEFGDAMVREYDRLKASELTRALQAYPSLVFEGHSTDYQSSRRLREMVDDGICILKVGPALTFYLREAMFALSYIEEELLPKGQRSNYRQVLQEAMIKQPENWKQYYRGSAPEQAFKRKYSLSDRSRYYLQDLSVVKAHNQLLNNLSNASIPFSLLSQFMPVQARKVRSGEFDSKPQVLLISRIFDCLDDYVFATLRI